jgi:hypothetical protein
MPDQSLIDALMGSWPARLGMGMLQGAMAPGRAYQSTPDNPVTTEQMIDPAANLAGLAMTGAMPFGVRNAVGMGIKAYHGSPSAPTAEQFAAMAQRGRMHYAGEKYGPAYEEMFGKPPPPSELKPTKAQLAKAQSPVDFGRIYGYSEDDIAHFYNQRRMGHPMAYDEYKRDLESSLFNPDPRHIFNP